MIAPLLENIGSAEAGGLAGSSAEEATLPANAPDVIIPPEEEGDDVFVFPATASQRRFWLLDQLVPGGNSALNMPLAARLTGQLEREALTRALNEIVRRHEILRTSFQCERGQLQQLIAPALELPVPLVDVRDFPAAERERLPEHLLGEEAQRPFDLARGPAIRARLVRIAPDEHLLLITVHHIVSDGWSNGVLVRELGELYAAYVRDEPSPLPELPIQFADYCQWQQEHLPETAAGAPMAYWREMLAGELPVLELPIDRPRRSARGQALLGGVRQEVLPPVLLSALKALAVRNGVSPYMLFLTAFTVLLHRYSGGQEDILVNTPSANRDRREVEPLIGPFVNPLLLRADLSGDPTFAQLLGRMRGVVLGAFEHAAVPFEKVLEERPPRRLQASFLLQSNSLWPARMHELSVAPLTVTSGAVLAEWSASVVDEGTQTRFMIVYNADLYDAATIDRVLASYRRLLESVAAPGGSETAISHLALEPVAERSEGTILLADRWRLPAESSGWMDVCLAANAVPVKDEFGRSRTGIEVLVLDRRAQPLPIGVAGEICLRGLTETHRQALAEAGLKLPPAGAPWKTGDLGRRLADGRIEWMGRAEEEVRVHGLRVDPGAIAAALRAHPHVREAAVLWPERNGGEGRRLTAYVQHHGGPHELVGQGNLRDFLRETLPEEWIPADFVLVERFPLTADGRLDAAALADLATRAALAPETKEDAPFLTIHYQLIDLWQQLLGVSAIGIRDDFFALGGNSLLAMRMLYRIEQIFGKALLPVTLFKQPTIEHLAAEMLKRDEGQPATAVVTLNAQGAKTPIFYLHGDFHGGGFYAMKLARHLGPDQPFYSLPPTELTDPGNPPTVEEMAGMQVESIREVRPHGPYVIGGFCLGGLIAYEVARQLTAAGEVVERLLIIDAILKNPRLRRLRWAAEGLGRLRGLNAERQLYLFCRLHFLLARVKRWSGMPLRDQTAIVSRRLGGLWQSASRRFRRAQPQPVGSAPVEVEAKPPDADWFDPRWDVPLVYLWSAGSYLPAPYAGATTVLLSRDLFRGPQHRGLQNWRRYLGAVDVRELPGSHLACITEHVDALAETIDRCLEIPLPEASVP